MEGSWTKTLEPRPTAPVTLLTGYLGAGKTTLLKHILHGQHGLRIAVILNEIGEEVGIESAFVREPQEVGRASNQWIELTNGCLCCSVKDEFLQALEQLLADHQAFDYVIIETTGLANPAPIVSSLWTDRQLEADVLLDAVITVVDAHHIMCHLAQPLLLEGQVSEAVVQIAYADVIILNKIDLVSEAMAQQVEATIRAINSHARVERTEHGKVDLRRILNQQQYIQSGDELEEQEGGSARLAHWLSETSEASVLLLLRPPS